MYPFCLLMSIPLGSCQFGLGCFQTMVNLTMNQPQQMELAHVMLLLDYASQTCSRCNRLPSIQW